MSFIRIIISILVRVAFSSLFLVFSWRVFARSFPDAFQLLLSILQIPVSIIEYFLNVLQQKIICFNLFCPWVSDTTGRCWLTTASMLGYKLIRYLSFFSLSLVLSVSEPEAWEFTGVSASLSLSSMRFTNLLRTRISGLVVLLSSSAEIVRKYYRLYSEIKILWKTWAK